MAQKKILDDATFELGWAIWNDEELFGWEVMTVMRTPDKGVLRFLADDETTDLSVNGMEREMEDTHGSGGGYI